MNGDNEAKTNLFAAILLSGELDLAHATDANGLADDPLARLRRDDGARPRVLGDRCPGGRIGVATQLLLGGRRAASAITGGGGGRGSHVGMEIVAVVDRVLLRRWGCEGSGPLAGGRWTVSAVAPLAGVGEGGGYVRGVVVILGDGLLRLDGTDEQVDQLPVLSLVFSLIFIFTGG